jgi:glycosyltransferase involved in cell wall biosynthesis
MEFKENLERLRIPVTGICMIEPDLLDYKGHCYNFANSVWRASSDRTHAFKVIISDNCIPEIQKAIPSLSVFPQRPNDSVFRWPIIRHLFAPLAFNWNLFRGLKKEALNFLGPNWLVYMGTTQHLHMLALWAWLRRFKPEQAPTLILTLRLSIYRSDLHRWSPSVIWYMLGLRLLERLTHKYRIHFVTDSAMLVDEFHRLTNLSIHVVPIPHIDLIQSASNLSRSPSSFVRMVSLGSARVAKGFDILAKAIQLLHSRGELDNIKLDLHCYHSVGDEVISSAVGLLKDLNHPNINLIDRVVNETEYYQMLADADVVLIPYVQSIYLSNTSGIFVEAVAAGKPVVVTEGTWMSAQLKTFGAGITCRDLDPENLARAICEGRDKHLELEKKAQTGRVEWVKYNSPKNFVNELLRIVDMPL